MKYIKGSVAMEQKIKIFSLPFLSASFPKKGAENKVAVPPTTYIKGIWFFVNPTLNSIKGLINGTTTKWPKTIREVRPKATRVLLLLNMIRKAPIFY